ncbi:MAG: hypothetical protein WBA73_11950 [Devosia sp.]
MSDPAELEDPKPVYRTFPSTSTRPDRTLVAIVLLAVMALAGMVSLLPSPEEKAEGLLAEGRYGDAIEMLVAVEDERPLNAYEGYMLFKLYMLTRQPDNASMLLDQEPALQAGNAWALRQLSDLYREVRNVPGEASALRQLYDLSPTDTDFARLRVLYRLTGDVTNEASLLAQAIAAGHVEKVHAERLAYLRTLPLTGSQAAMWVAPSGSFRVFADAPLFQVLALSDFVAPPTTSLE